MSKSEKSTYCISNYVAFWSEKGSDGESEKINQYSVWGWTAGTPGFLGQ